MKKILATIFLGTLFAANAALAAPPDTTCNCYCTPKTAAEVTLPVPATPGMAPGSAPTSCTPPANATTPGPVADQAACTKLCADNYCSNMSACRPSCSTDADCTNGLVCISKYCASAPTTPTTPTDPGSTLAPIELQNPRLTISIPTLNVAELVASRADNGEVTVPYIAVYVSAWYRYGVALASILAIIMIMAGGFRWLAAGGGAPQISEAKSMITNAVVGLILAFGSYVALQIVNPELTKLKPIVIKGVVADIINVSDEVYGNDATDTVSAPPNSTKTDLDNIFKAYASCYGLDWRVLKGIAGAESGLNPSAQNGQYVGLFQESPSYCSGKLTSFSFLNCSNLADPEANTAAAASTIASNLQTIEKSCPGINLESELLLLYTSHNNGPGVMKYVVGHGGCASGSQQQFVRQFYETCADNKPAYLSKDGTCSGTVRGVTPDQGAAKWNYGHKVVSAVNALGATKAFAPGDQATCPSNTGERVVK